jgi:hypothetical protein
MVSKVIAAMWSEVIVATMCSNNDLSQQYSKQDGWGTGVSRPGGEGMGEEAHGEKSLDQQVLKVSPWCAVLGGGLAP